MIHLRKLPYATRVVILITRTTITTNQLLRINKETATYRGVVLKVVIVTVVVVVVVVVVAVALVLAVVIVSTVDVTTAPIRTIITVGIYGFSRRKACRFSVRCSGSLFLSSCCL